MANVTVNVGHLFEYHDNLFTIHMVKRLRDTSGFTSLNYRLNGPKWFNKIGL